MESLPETMAGREPLPRLGDGSINLRELFRLLAEEVVERYQRVNRAMAAARSRRPWSPRSAAR